MNLLLTATATALLILLVIDGASCLANVALKRPAFHSSAFRGQKAGLANDGKMLKDARHCMHTKMDVHPWWAVDLGSRLQVDSIKFTNRKNYGNRASDFIVGLTDVSPAKKAPQLKKYDICGQWIGRVKNGATVRMKCNAHLPPRRYVVVQLPRTDFLTICEFQVFAKPKPKPKPKPAVTQPQKEKVSASVCPEGFSHVKSTKSCYKVIADNVSWDVSGVRCRSLHKDAHLVVINNAEEQAALATLLNTKIKAKEIDGCVHDGPWGWYFWTAGQRINRNALSTFVWRTALHTEYAMTYTNWRPGQPDYYGRHEPCMHMLSNAGYTWNDARCSDKSCSVCEIDL